MSITYNSMFEYLDFELPYDCVMDCSHMGRCDDDVEYWQDKLKLNLDRKSMIDELLLYGSWLIDELELFDDDELEQKCIWLASIAIREELILIIKGDHDG